MNAYISLHASSYPSPFRRLLAQSKAKTTSSFKKDLVNPRLSDEQTSTSPAWTTEVVCPYITLLLHTFPLLLLRLHIRPLSQLVSRLASP